MLARLLHAPDDGQIRALVNETTFTYYQATAEVERIRSAARRKAMASPRRREKRPLGRSPRRATLRPHVFCAHSRAEIYVAWRGAASTGTTPSLVLTRHEVAKRLTRTPSWAPRHVDWPFGELDLAYFDRLAATPQDRSGCGQPRTAIHSRSLP